MDKKRSFGYKPKIITQADIQNNMKTMFKQNPGQQRQNISWKPTHQPQQQVQQNRSINVDNYWKPKQVPIMQKQQPAFQQQPKQEEQPYWSAGEWEDWAVDIYNNYPDMRQFLPAWFIEAVEQE